MKFYLTTILLIFLASCKVTEQKLTGSFVYEYQQKTKLILNADKTFKFINIYDNPYLYTFDHPDERFYFTEGHWEILNKKLYLTSYKDSLTYKTTDIKIDPAGNPRLSIFNFYDIYNDSIGTGSVKLSNNNYVIPGRKVMYAFSEDLAKNKTLEFEFFGYKPWTYSAPDSLNYVFNIYFTPPFKPGYFKKDMFTVKRKTIIQNKGNEKYRFKKNKPV